MYEPLPRGGLPRTHGGHARGADGRIGTLVVVPDGSSSELFEVEVVTSAQGGPVSGCVARGYAGCIVARRILRFEPHTSITLPIATLAGCEGVVCDAATTCSAGVCVSAAISEGACTGDGVCALPDAGASTPEGSPDAPTSDPTMPVPPPPPPPPPPPMPGDMMPDGGDGGGDACAQQGGKDKHPCADPSN